MANKKHLASFKKGKKAWSQWRFENPETTPDFSGANLRGAKPGDANLDNAQFIRADLSASDLRRADLRHADLSFAQLRGADLRDAVLKGANLSEADLDGANLGGADLSCANLSDTKLNRADLSGAMLDGTNASNANLSDANLSAASLHDAKLTHAILIGAHLSHVNLRRADLTRANLNEANLHDAHLDGANLRKSQLMRANLINANLSGAILVGANLIGADLRVANLRGVDLEEAIVGYTILGSCDLSGVKGLNRVLHVGPSTVGIDTIYKSAGKISEVFLLGCGVPEGFITEMHSLIGAVDGIQFYSCFISYSGNDEDFAKRLHGKMRDAHLRVWFAPEEMKGGNLVIEQIETAIRLYDKLLIVLSEASLKSEWVMTELRKAFKAQKQSGKRKLFPVRLVDFETLRDWECFDADSGKDLAVELREYFIPDFSNWKDHDQFETAFTRLLKDLRAEERAK